MYSTLVMHNLKQTTRQEEIVMKLLTRAGAHARNGGGKGKKRRKKEVTIDCEQRWDMIQNVDVR